MACGCQQNRWQPDSGLVEQKVGPSAGGYFYGGDENGNEKPNEPLPSAPKWNPDSGTED